MQIEPQCIDCKHYKGGLSCDAFELIPDDIIFTGDFNHKAKHPDQTNDILFELDDKYIGLQK